MVRIHREQSSQEFQANAWLRARWINRRYIQDLLGSFPSVARASFWEFSSNTESNAWARSITLNGHEFRVIFIGDAKKPGTKPGTHTYFPFRLPFAENLVASAPGFS